MIQTTASTLFGGDDRTKRLRQLVGRTSPTGTGSLPAGIVAVEGQVRIHEGTVPAPLDDRDHVVVHYERRRRDGKRYELVDASVDAVPFVVEDDTGRVLVEFEGVEWPDDPDGISALTATGPLLVSARKTDRFFGNETAEDRVRIQGQDPFESLAEARKELGYAPDWVHVQSTLDPGDTVYVLGEVDQSRDPPAIGPGDDGAFVVSDLGRPALHEQLDRRTTEVGPQFVRFLLFGLLAILAVVVVLFIVSRLFGSLLF